MITAGAPSPCLLTAPHPISAAVRRRALRRARSLERPIVGGDVSKFENPLFSGRDNKVLHAQRS